MTTQVQHTVTDPETGPIRGAQVIVDVYPDGPGYVNSIDSTVIAPRKRKTDANGLVTFDLVANDDIVPAGTVYRVRDYPAKGIIRSHFISVPAAGGPYWLGDILAEPPGTLPSAALTDHLEDPTPHDPMLAEANLWTAMQTFIGAIAAKFKPPVFPGDGTDQVRVEWTNDVQTAVLDLTGYAYPTAEPTTAPNRFLVTAPTGGFVVSGMFRVVKNALKVFEADLSVGNPLMGFFGKDAITQPVVGFEFAELFAALDDLGLIDDQTFGFGSLVFRGNHTFVSDLTVFKSPDEASSFVGVIANDDGTSSIIVGGVGPFRITRANADQALIIDDGAANKVFETVTATPYSQADVMMAWNGNAPVTKPVVTGSWGGNAAGASLAAALDSLGLIDDQSTP